MKSLIILTILTLSVTAFACPDLTGKFECSSGTLELSQKTVDGVTTYSMKEAGNDTFIADGKERSLEPRYQVSSVKYIASCGENDLTINVNAVLSANGMEVTAIYYVNRISDNELFFQVKEGATGQEVVRVQDACIKK